MNHVSLHCFGKPLTPDIQLAASYRYEKGELTILFELQDPLHQISFPAESPPARLLDGLYEHTCLEVFISNSSGNYVEWNLAPTGNSAVFTFESYRKRLAPTFVPSAPLVIVQERAPKSFSLKANLKIEDHPLFRNEKNLKMGISAVLEFLDGSKQYWALTHTTDKPDFHQSDSFILSLR